MLMEGDRVTMDLVLHPHKEKEEFGVPFQRIGIPILIDQSVCLMTVILE